MNQRGDATCMGVFVLAALAGVMLLCALELHRSFNHLRSRSKLLLCVKETKGELHRYLQFMGRSNWGIKNVDKIKWIAVFIPGLQGAALNAEKAKRLLITLQDSTLLLYLAKLSELKSNGCPIDPQLLLTPYERSGHGYTRSSNETAKLRKKKWDYYFVRLPYGLRLQITAQEIDSINPKIMYQVKESAVTSSFLSSFVY